VAPAALIELLRATPLSEGKVGFAWRAAVGPAIDRASAVKLEDGVLIVETTSPEWASEIRRSSATILTRLESLLGSDVVARILVRQ
jgi:predicted nucleic acid-binding Zn ribbon protein